MRVMSRWFYSATLAAALPASLVWAQDADLFGRLDVNKDGFVTEDEVPAENKGLYERLVRTSDKDGDKKLNREEFTSGTAASRPVRDANNPGEPGRPGQPPRFQFDPAQLFNRIDQNGDGKIVSDEMPERFRDGFGRLDANSDGGVDREEFGKGFVQLAQRLQPPNTEGQRPPLGGPLPLGPLMRALDTDNNGELSAAEIAAASSSLRSLDKNSDGTLTREELMPTPPAGVRPGGLGLDFLRQRLKEADANGDGKISKDEAPEGLKGFFDRIDANGDGFIDEAEGRDAAAKMQAVVGNLPGGLPSPEQAQQRFKESDTNGDGKISKDEATGRLKEFFDRVDANGDGFVDETEARQAFAKLATGLGQGGLERKPGERPAVPKKDN